MMDTLEPVREIQPYMTPWISMSGGTWLALQQAEAAVLTLLRPSVRYRQACVEFLRGKN